MIYWCERITELREASGLGLVDFGATIGQGREAIRTWCLLHRVPKLSRAWQVAASAGRTLDQMIGATPLEGPIVCVRAPREDVSARWSETIVLLSRSAVSMRALADLTGQCPATIRNWTRGYRDPTLTTTAEFADALGVPLHDLVAGAVSTPEIADEIIARKRAR